MKMEEYDIVYEERVPFKWIWLFLVGFIVAIFSLTISAFYRGFTGSLVAEIWFYLIVSGGFALVLVVFPGFRKLKIKMDPSGIQVGLWFFKTHVPYEKIENCSSYEGFGIGRSRTRRRWLISYNGGGKHVIIDYKDKNRSLAFSTKNPERILGIIKEYATTRD